MAQKSPHPIAGIDALLKKYGISLSPSQIEDLLFQTIKSDHAKKKAAGINFPEVTIDRIWMQLFQFKNLAIARCFAVEYEMIVNPVYPMPYLLETLQRLKQKNIPLGIISNAQFFTPHLFDFFCGDFPDKLGFDPDLIFYSYDYGYAKPALYLFDQAVFALNRKGLKPADVIYVGNDMLNDIYPAHTIGFQTCLFAGDARSLRLRKKNSKCESIKPDAIIIELNQLTDMIRS